MTEKTYGMAKVISQERIEQDIVSLWLETEACQTARCGQFVNLYSNQNGRLLPRPISICEIDGEKKALRLVYRIAGEGTREISKLSAGEEIKLLGPLGNGFPTEEFAKRTVLLMGGGIGIPPMLEMAKAFGEKSIAVLGYRDSHTFLLEDFQKTGCRILLSSDDGSVGVKGTVIDALKEAKATGDVIFACGPKPMLRGIKAFASDANIKCFVSMEERMACGIGACLGCVCKSTTKDPHSNVNNKRVCKDGPVFDAKEVEL